MAGHGEVVLTRTSPTLHPPSPPTVHHVATSTLRVNKLGWEACKKDMSTRCMLCIILNKFLNKVVFMILHYMTMSVVILCMLFAALASTCIALYFVATGLPTYTDLVLL